MGMYLNSQTRTDVVLVAGVIEQLNDITFRWENLMKNPPKKVIDYMKASSRFAARGMRELDKDLDNNEVARIYRMAETTKFSMEYTQFDLSAKAKGIITYDITEEERDNIVEALAEVRCSGCNGCNADKCTVRQQFFKWDVTPIHDSTDAQHPCQYMPPEGVM